MGEQDFHPGAGAGEDVETERAIFAEALAKTSPEQLATFLDEACAGDAELRGRVDALLAAHERAGSFLEAPPPGFTIGLPAAVQLAERPGSVIGPYKLLEQIGEGGMGVVFMAEQLRPVRRRVALKIIKPGLDTRQVIARFEAERQALAMMDHPNIAKVLDAGATDTGRPYFVMELVKGIPITEYCDQQQLHPRARLELFIQVCHAVQHAHTKGIIHRDLKPTNVLVTHDDGDKPVPKVIDFGVAKATAGQRLTDATLFTEFRQLIGTPLYMSPEQAEMSAVSDVDTRSDVYSLGVLLYELLTGTTPFDKTRLAKAAFEEVRRIIREEEPPRPSTRLSTLGDTLTTVSMRRQMDPKRLGQTVRGELDWIVMRALEKERSRRYATPIGFAQDVERYLADEPVEACPPSRSYRLRKFIRRNKAAMTTTAIIAAALVAATGVSTWQAVRATRAEQRVSAERDRAEEALREKEAALAGRDAALAEARLVNMESHALVTFLQEDVIGAASPWKTGGREVTVREALDNAAAAVATKFQSQPRIRAAVRYAVGATYLHLGRPDLALPHIEASRSDFRTVLPPSHPTQVTSLLAYARVLLELGRYEEIEAVAREAIERSTAIHGQAHASTMDARFALAQSLAIRNRIDESVEVLKQLVEQSSGLSDFHSKQIFYAGYLASVLLEHGKAEEAERYIELVTAGSLPAMPPDGADGQQNTLVLANILRVSGRHGEATAFVEKLLAARRQALGSDHPDTISVLDFLGNCLQQAGRLAEAEVVEREVVERRLRVQGPHHRLTITSQYGLGVLLGEMDRLPEAAQIYREALANARQAFGADDRLVRHILNNLAVTSLSDSEAEPVYREVVEASTRVLGPSHPETLLPKMNLAARCARLGKVDEAEALYREVVEAAKRGNLKILSSAAYGLSLLLDKKDERAEAHEMLLLAVESAPPVNGPADADHLEPLQHLAFRHEEQGDLEVAETYWGRLLAARRVALGDDHEDTLKTMFHRAELLRNLKRLAEAEALFRELLERRRRLSGNADRFTILAAKDLADLLESQRRVAEAEPLYAEVAEMATGGKLSPGEAARLASHHGTVLARLGRHAEAEPALLAALERLRGTGQGGHERARAVVDALVTVCAATGCPDEAARWRAELVRLDPATSADEGPGGVMVLDDFERGAGRFASPVFGGSGSTVGLASSSATRVETGAGDGGAAVSGSAFQRLTLCAAPSTPTTAPANAAAYVLRHLSNGGTATRNFRMSNTGSVGFFMRTTTPGLSVSLLVDENLAVNPANMERGRPIEVKADGQWHLYQWDLADAEQWEQWDGVPGDGKIDGPAVTIDAILITSAPGRDAVVDLDAVTYNSAGSLVASHLNGVDNPVDAAAPVAAAPASNEPLTPSRADAEAP